MKGKTDEELNQMKHEMINSLFDKFGEDEVIILDTIIEDADKKSELECFAESIFHLSQADVICMGPGWKTARGCRLEHTIACDYEMPVIYLDPLIKYGDSIEIAEERTIEFYAMMMCCSDHPMMIYDYSDLDKVMEDIDFENTMGPYRDIAKKKIRFDGDSEWLNDMIIMILKNTAQ